MSLEAKVIAMICARIENESKQAKINQRLAQRRGSQSDADYAFGCEAAFEYALQIIKTEMDRRDLE